MYLSKNSRCVLRKSMWLSANLVGRNFKISFKKSRARWPEDDPTKPPLRLNIPKDTSVTSPYQFNSQISLNSTHGGYQDGKLPEDWLEPTYQSVKCEKDECGSNDFGEQEAYYNRYQARGGALEEDRDSSERLDSQNFLVKSKSIPSMSSKESGNDEMDQDRSYNIKKIRSYEGIKLNSDDNLCNISEIEDKNGILTIKISLNDQSRLDNNMVKGFSQIETNDDQTSDEQIRALAEAIIRELRHRGGDVDPDVEKSHEAEEDEAFLVIINLMDKDGVEQSSSFAYGNMDISEKSFSGTVKDEKVNAPIRLSEVDSFAEQLQVRNLDFNDDVGKTISKRKIERNPGRKSVGNFKRTDYSNRPVSGTEYYFKDVQSKRTINRNNIRNEADCEWSGREVDDLFNYKQGKKTRNVKKEHKFTNSSFQLQKEKEKRKEAFEKSLRKARLSNGFSPAAKKFKQMNDLPKKKLKMKNRSRSLTDLTNLTKKTPTYRLAESYFARPIEYAPEREMRMRTKIVPENYLEKKIEYLGKESSVEEAVFPALMLKPLSKQITLVDDLPELLNYPEYKYSVLSKSCGGSKGYDDGKPNIKSIRSYHHTCNTCDKLSKGTGDVKAPPLTVIARLSKSNGSSSGDHPKSSGGRDELEIILKNDRVRLNREYPKNMLDKSCDALETNSKTTDLKGCDVYLQEGNANGNAVASAEAKNVENKPDLATPVMQSCSPEPPHPTNDPKKESQKAIVCTEEKCEPDITDALQVGKCTDSALDGVCYGTSRNDKCKDERSKDQDRMKTFMDSATEAFEMNVNCLNEEVIKQESYAKPDAVLINPPTDCKDGNGEVAEDTNTPKLSDNIINLANEGLAESKGCSSVDSLSMMKKVKEIVDLDLQNAEKIFVPAESERPEATCLTEKVQNPPEASLPPLCLEPSPVMDALPKDFNPLLLKSVVIYDEGRNCYYVHDAELESAMNARAQEMGSLILYDKGSFDIDENLLRIVNLESQEFKGDVPVYVHVPQEVENANYILKGGDSIIVYDEQTRTWKVDYTLLKEKEEKLPEQQEVSEGQKEVEEMRKDQVLNYETPPEKYWKKKEDSVPNRSIKSPKFVKIESETNPKDTPAKGGLKKEKAEREKKFEELRRKVKKDSVKEDAQEIRRKNSDLYDDVFIEIKKPDLKKGEENPKDGTEPPKMAKKADGVDRSEHYVSDNILEMSKSSALDKGLRLRLNRVETVKLNITPTMRPPSKVTEINLNKKTDESKGSDGKNKTEKTDKNGAKKPEHPNFYKKFEKYKTPFSDPEYEEKPMKINSDLESNPNLKKLDSCNKTLVLQDINKTSENVESWLRDETDKMATLLLKVLQEAAEGNSRKRIAAKGPGKGNPYEAIRKKQETGSGLMKTKKKELSKKRGARDVPLQKAVEGAALVEKTANPKTKKKGLFPVIEDDSHVEVVTPDSLLPKEVFRSCSSSLTVLNEDTIDDIPGPNFLKKMSSFWKFLPEIGCQTTIFFSVRLFQLAKLGSSLLAGDEAKTASDPFSKFFTRYGPVVKLKGPLLGDVVLINRPEDISSVLIKAPVSPARSVLDSVENCRNRVRQKNFPIGITDSCNGIDWDIVRKSTIDVSNKGCLHYFTMIKSADAMLVDRIQTSRNKQKQVPDDFVNDVKKWCMEGLCGVLFDKSFGFLEKKNAQVHWVCESERLMRHLNEATDHLCQCESKFQIWRFVNTPSLNGLNQAYQSLDLIISKYIYQAEITLRKKKKALTNNKTNANKNLNFLESMLLNDRMTPEEISANLIDILLISANTSTVALSFLLYNLAQNSRVQRELFKEVKGLLPDKSSDLNYHQLHSLKYLQACLKESTRLNIPVPMLLRVLPSNVALANYHVPHGTHLVMNAQTACMKEHNFDEPERFKPERWMDQDCVHPFSSIPFCNGPRASFVKRLAEIQLWTCVAKIIRNFHVEYHFGDIKGTGSVFSYPDKPLKLTFVERDE